MEDSIQLRHQFSPTNTQVQSNFYQNLSKTFCQYREVGLQKSYGKTKELKWLKIIMKTFRNKKDKIFAM